eukprot:scaffold29429_cov30-Tisochrysis_lutea.AAC.7
MSHGPVASRVCGITSRGLDRFVGNGLCDDGRCGKHADGAHCSSHAWPLLAPCTPAGLASQKLTLCLYNCGELCVLSGEWRAAGALSRPCADAALFPASGSGCLTGVGPVRVPLYDDGPIPSGDLKPEHCDASSPACASALQAPHGLAGHAPPSQRILIVEEHVPGQWRARALSTPRRPEVRARALAVKWANPRAICTRAHATAPPAQAARAGARGAAAVPTGWAAQRRARSHQARRAAPDRQRAASARGGWGCRAAERATAVWARVERARLWGGAGHLDVRVKATRADCPRKRLEADPPVRVCMKACGERVELLVAQRKPLLAEAVLKPGEGDRHGHVQHAGRARAGSQVARAILVGRVGRGRLIVVGALGRLAAPAAANPRAGEHHESLLGGDAVLVTQRSAHWLEPALHLRLRLAQPHKQRNRPREAGRESVPPTPLCAPSRAAAWHVRCDGEKVVQCP